MDIYKDSYFLLFNAITDAHRYLTLNDTADAMKVLVKAQQDAEEMVISSEEYTI